MRLPALLLLLMCGLAAGCGDSEERAESTPTPTPSQTPTPSATPEAEPTAFAPSAPEPPEELLSEREQEQGGPGDERSARYRTRLAIGRRGVAPRRVAVRGFFALEFVIRNDTRRSHRVTFARRAVTVPGGETRTLRHGGVRPGRHVLDAGAAGRVEVLAAPPGTP